MRALWRALALQPHPEGGGYIEHYKGPRRGSGQHDSTAIYYLLPHGAASAWHRVDKDELWHHYEGTLVELHVIIESPGRSAGEPPARGRKRASYEVLRLGPVGRAGARPCQVVPAGAWQAARAIERRQGRRREGYALVGCTIAPGFRFSDWKLADAADLARLAEQAPTARAALREMATPGVRAAPPAARVGKGR